MLSMKNLFNGLIKAKVEETVFLNPLKMVNILEKVMAEGKT